jgi:hypothetical protein
MQMVDSVYDHKLTRIVMDHITKTIRLQLGARHKGANKITEQITIFSDYGYDYEYDYA